MSAVILEHPSASHGIAARLMEAMDRFRQLRSQGMDFEDACTILEAGLRAALPPRTDRPVWVDPCARCDGTGWEPYEKWVSLYQENARYVRYCECSRGQAMKGTASTGDRVGGKPRRRGWVRI